MKLNHQEHRMNRTTIKRILITLGVTAGVLAATATQASALAGSNHSEPTLNRN